MEYLVISILLWLVLLAAGFPFAAALLPASERRFAMAIAPLLGYGVLSFVGYYLYRLDIGGTNQYGPALALAVPALTILLGALRRRIFETLRDARPDRACGLAMLGAAFAFLAISTPFLIIGSGKAISIAISNLDVAELACVSRYLQEFSRSVGMVLPGGGPHFAWSADDVWFGPSYIAALTASFSGTEAAQTQSLAMNVMAAQSGAIAFLIAYRMLGISRAASFVIALLVGVNPVVLYTIWQAFGGQMITMPFLTLAIYLHAGCLEVGTSLRESARRGLATVIVFTAIVITYHYMVIVLALLLGTCTAVTAWLRRDWRALSRGVLLLLGVVGLHVVLNPLRIRALFNSLQMLSGNNGWFMAWVSPDVVLGDGMAALMTSTPLATPRAWWMAGVTVLLCVSLAGAWRMRRSGRLEPVAFYLGFFLPTLLIGFFYAVNEGQAGGAWGGYRSFKITASFAPVTMLAAGCAWFAVENRTRYWKSLLALAAVAVGTISLINAYALTRFFEQHAFVPSPGYRALRNLETSLEVPGINILDADHRVLLWTNYYTMRIPSVFQRFPYGGRPVGSMRYSYSLTLKGREKGRAVANASNDIFGVQSAPAAGSIDIGDVFLLYRTQPKEDVLIGAGEGWWPAEPTHRWTGATGPNFSVFIDSKQDDVRLWLEATYLIPLSSDSLRAMFVDGQQVRLQQSRAGFRSDEFVVSAGHHTVFFECRGNPGPPVAWDQRTLGIAFTAMTVRFALTPNQ